MRGKKGKKGDVLPCLRCCLAERGTVVPVRGRGMCNAARRALSGRFCVRTLLCDCPGRPCGVSSNTRKVSHGSCCHILTPPFQLRLQPVLSDGCTRLSVKNPFCPDGRTDRVSEAVRTRWWVPVQGGTCSPSQRIT